MPYNVNKFSKYVERSIREIQTQYYFVNNQLIILKKTAIASSEAVREISGTRYWAQDFTLRSSLTRARWSLL